MTFYKYTFKLCVQDRSELNFKSARFLIIVSKALHSEHLVFKCLRTVCSNFSFLESIAPLRIGSVIVTLYSPHKCLTNVH